eukprot:NODE_644_length_815_cov_1.481214_g636_i0.p1 GENE.NODE_644_length_815_cov_1.481214_g636_i0~~NODE_644_length_815_cov_1.481214_g636_i0.p1  ORF type:complete len:232 (-),score=98.85 NODE_644_length_815_cov_1.481214_g636_i0:38-733(-)
MNILTDSLASAVLMVFSFEKELADIVLVSVTVSGASTLIASLAGIPAGFFIAFESFKGKRIIITILNTLLALPTVVIGLVVYAMISRRGPMGSLGLLYTKKAMVMGQVILIFPLVTTFVMAAVSRIDKRYRKTAMTLGAGRARTALAVLREARFGIVAAVVAAYGRVISEVGVSMMLGGNARGFTRTMTTAMALEYNKGSFSLAVALGIVLLSISFGINLLFHFFQGRAES